MCVCGVISCDFFHENDDSRLQLASEFLNNERAGLLAVVAAVRRRVVVVLVA